MSHHEELEVLNDDYRELQQMAQDAFEDALLMDSDQAQDRQALHELIDSLRSPCAGGQWRPRHGSEPVARPRGLPA